MIWTEQQAHDYLMLEVRKHENYVKDMVDVPVNANQFSALVSLSYNMGPANLRKSSLLRKLNDGDYAGATEDFNRYTRAGGKVYKGLVSRRKDEQRLFSKLPRKELIKKSRKLTLIERLRLLIPVGGVGTWFSFENLDSVRQFMTDYSGFIVLFAGFSIWAVLRLIESYSMEDYAKGRYVPSGATDAE